MGGGRGAAGSHTRHTWLLIKLTVIVLNTHHTCTGSLVFVIAVVAGLELGRMMVARLSTLLIGIGAAAAFRLPDSVQRCTAHAIIAGSLCCSPFAALAVSGGGKDFSGASLGAVATRTDWAAAAMSHRATACLLCRE